MAGPTLGASAPVPCPSSTRTRRYHGAVSSADGVLITVCTSRRADDWPGVTLQAGNAGELQLYFANYLDAQAARALARALLAGAEAADAAQRHPPVVRSAPTGVPRYYSALTPQGERVLLPVGTYFDRAGRLTVGQADDSTKGGAQ